MDEQTADALKLAQAFIAVMFGQGPDAVIPEEVVTPLGIPINLGKIWRDIDAALQTGACQRERS